MIDGNLAGDGASGVSIVGDNNRISALSIQKFRHDSLQLGGFGITIAGSGNSVIKCYVGVDLHGTRRRGVDAAGIVLAGDDNRIGGVSGEGNVIWVTEDLVSGLKEDSEIMSSAT